ncbi:MAG: DUF1311 domain-containing protein [Sulfuritalea sp.]|nr:DUF1311 domain-containing protein [Sulfuritalea sp.]
MALVAVCGFRRSLGTGKSLSFVMPQPALRAIAPLRMLDLRKTTVTLLLGATIFACSSAFADATVTEIEAELKSCISSASAYQTWNECTWRAYRKMDVRLNETFRSLVSKLSKDRQALLRRSQSRWLSFRNAEVDLSTSLNLPAGAQLQAMNEGHAYYRTTMLRVIELEHYLESAKDLD